MGLGIGLGIGLGVDAVDPNPDPDPNQVARREIEKSLHMYVHVRRHRALLAAKRAAEEAARRADAAQQAVSALRLRVRELQREVPAAPCSSGSSKCNCINASFLTSVTVFLRRF